MVIRTERLLVFIESLKAKLLVDCQRKNRRWKRNRSNRLRYVWVREVGERNHRKHYHVLLLLNKDFYHGAGNLTPMTVYMH